MADSQRKTANLFDENSAPSVGWYCGSDDIIRSSTAIKATYIPCSPNTTYTIAKVQSARFKVAWTANEPALGVTYYGLTNVSGTSVTVTTGSTAAYLYIEYYTSASDTYTEAEIRNTIMLNIGSQPLPYEPYGWLHSLRKLGTATDTITTLPADLYADGNNATVGLVGDMSQTGTPTPQNPIQPSETGDLETSGDKTGQYKIPISSANTTTPVYLGEVESTRKVYKWELTGEEDWLSSQADSSKHYLSTVSPDYIRANSQVTYVSSHYVAYEQTTSASLVPNGSFSMASNTTAQRLYIADATYTTNDTWKAYLAQQYAAGTPVTVWYVLANETTTTLNEPLRKIGDYADTVSGITIPTITGKDTFDVLTTLKPSEVSLSYTGWHDASVGEWDGSEWQ